MEYYLDERSYIKGYLMTPYCNVQTLIKKEKETMKKNLCYSWKQTYDGQTNTMIVVLGITE